MKCRKQSMPYFTNEDGEKVFIAGAVIEEDGTINYVGGNGKGSPLDNYDSEDVKDVDSENDGNGSNGKGLYITENGCVVTRDEFNETNKGFRDSITRV